MNKFAQTLSGRAAAGILLTPDGEPMFEIFVGETGSWTVVVSNLDGRSCFVAAGDSRRQVKSVPGYPVRISA